MGVLRKSPKISSEEHARLQQIIRSNPEIRALQDEAGRRSVAAGRSVGWSDIPGQIRQILERQGVQIPDGYDVTMDGELVYTNKTPFLQQVAWGALPIGAVSAIGALAGPGAAGAAGSGAGSATAPAAASVLPSSSLPVEALMGGGASSMGLGGALKNVGKGALSFLGGGKDGGGFGLDDLIKLIVAGKGVKDLFGIGGDEEEAEWATFENESRGGRSLDPRDLLAQGLGQSEAALADAQTRAKTPVRLRSAFAQQPPEFSGGGLPMSIGVTGMDPALRDSSLLKSDSPAASDEEAFAALELLKGEDDGL